MKKFTLIIISIMFFYKSNCQENEIRVWDNGIDILYCFFENIEVKGNSLMFKTKATGVRFFINLDEDQPFLSEYNKTYKFSNKKISFVSKYQRLDLLKFRRVFWKVNSVFFS